MAQAQPKKPGKQPEIKSIKPGSPEMEMILSAGYPRIATRERAEMIIQEWKKDHSAQPWQEYQDALAFLAALDATPKVIDVDHPGYMEEVGIS